jgi:hypothetical protein
MSVYDEEPDEIEAQNKVRRSMSHLNQDPMHSLSNPGVVSPLHLSSKLHKANLRGDKAKGQGLQVETAHMTL